MRRWRCPYARKHLLRPLDPGERRASMWTRAASFFAVIGMSVSASALTIAPNPIALEVDGQARARLELVEAFQRDAPDAVTTLRLRLVVPEAAPAIEGLIGGVSHGERCTELLRVACRSQRGDGDLDRSRGSAPGGRVEAASGVRRHLPARHDLAPLHRVLQRGVRPTPSGRRRDRAVRARHRRHLPEGEGTAAFVAEPERLALLGFAGFAAIARLRQRVATAPR